MQRTNQQSIRFFFMGIALLLCSFVTSAQNHKKVILVLDDSGSMSGRKYESVNYSLQVLTALLEPEDQLFIVRGYELIPINLNDKQSQMDVISKWQMTSVGDYNLMTPAINELNKDEDCQKWMIIAADGMWGDYSGLENAFDTFYQKEKPYISFLSINRQSDKPAQNTVATLLSGYPLTDVLKTDAASNQELRSNLEQIAAEVISVSGKSLKVKKKTDSAVSFSPEIPIKKFIVLYQDNTETDALPQVTGAKISDVTLDVSNALDASNFNINRGQNPSTKLSGKIYSIADKDGELLSPGDDITINFDKTISTSNLKVIPVSAVKLKAYPKGKFEKIDEDKQIYSLCRDEKSITVHADILDLDDNVIDASALGKTKVKVYYGNEEKELKLDKNSFSLEVPVNEDEISFSIRAIYDGYFDYKSDIFTVKKVDCLANLPPEDNPQLLIQFPESGLADFTDDNNCFEGIVSLADGTPLSPEHFDLSFQDIPKYMDFKIEKTDKGWLVCRDIHVCKCLVETGDYKGKFLLTSTSPDYRSVTGRWAFKIKQDNSNYWINMFNNCKTCILFFIGTILLLIYIFGIIKKKRFAKGAIIEWQKETTDYSSKSRPRTQKLPTGFFNRWIIPFIPEKRNAHGITFIASGESSYIILPKKSQGKDMYNRGRPILKPGEKDEMIRVNTKLEIKRRNRIERLTYKY